MLCNQHRHWLTWAVGGTKPVGRLADTSTRYNGTFSMMIEVRKWTRHNRCSGPTNHRALRRSRKRFRQRLVIFELSQQTVEVFCSHRIQSINQSFVRQIKLNTSASARSVSHHMAPVDAQNSAIPGAIPPKIGEDLSEIWPNRRAKFYADR